MQNVVLLTNAVPVYGFLSLIDAHHPHREPSQRLKILDCGAGGPVPPLALFRQHGFEAWGIDASDAQLDRARQFCEQWGVELNLRPGDMRHIPFADETFDCVYEHFSMCHLTKRDAALAVGEMCRVLAPRGLCFLGVISADSWPKSLFGQESEPGEFWGEEEGEGPALHTMFTDAEAEALVSAWEILSREKRVQYMRDYSEQLSLEAWMDFRQEAGGRISPDAWQASYASRSNAFQYAHMYYYLRKPG